MLLNKANKLVSLKVQFFQQTKKKPLSMLYDHNCFIFILFLHIHLYIFLHIRKHLASQGVLLVASIPKKVQKYVYVYC